MVSGKIYVPAQLSTGNFDRWARAIDRASEFNWPENQK